MDASYRYTTEKKLGFIPVQISTLTQTGRSVAKAVVTREDAVAHKFIVDVVIAAVVIAAHDDQQVVSDDYRSDQKGGF